MSSSSEDPHSDDEPRRPSANAPTIEAPDSNTLRILLSTDNHLGYALGDPVRGGDSLAAMEEVLYLARHYEADMVLLAGDLFHDNQPRRPVLVPTLDLFRRYCWGARPIGMQVLDGEFSRGHVNYQDANVSVDLPVFSIHGNHDDPTREDGNSNLYAALDLLDTVNLVNYVGKQTQVNQVDISPILLKKGDTHVALYGLGSMRDERLNRMWRGQKVRFLKPETSSGEEDGDSPAPAEWFHLFALHQNRDLGRGTKNCVHESMIPEWMDLVCWGHEHECVIEPQESLVGTFRITQPGSSVATSLSIGEAVRKQVGILDIRGSQFRLLPIPLTQVRSFVMDQVSLSQGKFRLDPDDPKIEQTVSKVLQEHVDVLIHQAREQNQELCEAAASAGNPLAQAILENNGDRSQLPIKHTLERDSEVLIRLKVEHSGFQTLNNQRFGAKFIGKAANPTDILLFHRKKAPSESSTSNRKGKLKDVAPIAPEELEEHNIEDLIQGELEQGDKRLQVFDQKHISNALDAYVQKQQAQAIGETVGGLLDKQQKKLIQRNPASMNGEGSMAEGGQELAEEAPRTTKAKNAPTQKGRTRNVEESDYDYDEEEMPKPSKRKRKVTAPRPIATSRSQKSAAAPHVDSGSDLELAPQRPKSRRGARTNRSTIRYEESDDDEIVEAPPPKPARSRSVQNRKKMNYSMAEASEDSEIEILEEEPHRKQKSSTTSTRKKRSTVSSLTPPTSAKMSQCQLSFAPVSRDRRKTGKRRKYSESSDDENETTGQSFDVEEDWGTAKTDTCRTK